MVFLVLSGKERKLQVVGLHTVKHLFWQQTVPQPTTRIQIRGPNDSWLLCPLENLPGRSCEAGRNMCKCKSHRAGQVVNVEINPAELKRSELSRTFERHLGASRSRSPETFLIGNWMRKANKHHTARWGTTKYRIPCAPGGLQPHTANPVASIKCFLACNFWLWMARITASSKEAWAPPSLQHIWKILSGWTPSFSTIFRSSTLLSWYHFRSWTTFICRMNLS